MNSLSETSPVSGLLKSLAEKLGREELVSDTSAKMTALLDEEGMLVYFRLVEEFISLDRSFSLSLIQSGTGVLEKMKDKAARKHTLQILLAMGKPKWSVVQRAYSMLPRIADAESETVEKWLQAGSALAEIDQDVAIQYFEASLPMLAELGPVQFEVWSSLGREMAVKSWKAAREFFRVSPEVAKKTDHCDLERWARLGLYLIEKSPKVKAEYDAHSMLAAGSSAGKARKIELAVQYFKSAPQILGRLSVHDLEEWVEKGLETAETTRDKGSSYFSLQTGTSRTAVENLVKGLELRDIQSVLRSYAEALIGKKLQFRSSSMFYKNLPGLSRFFSVTDGTRIYLPSRIELFADEDLNFKTYKWMLTHELGHLLFGTFEIGLEDLRRFSELGNPIHAFKIFEFLEDERIDHLIGQQYPGLERDRIMIMEAYIRSQGRSAMTASVFEALSFRSLETGDISDQCGSRLNSLLKEALSKVIEPGCSVRDILNLAVHVSSSMNGESACEVCENRETSDRIFYRGILDFELVENSCSGNARLVNGLTERLREKNPEIAAESVQIALDRLEEALPVEAEELFWQISDSDRINELVEQVQNVIAEMETEKRFRRAVYYDEWDMKLDDYKKDWCRVREIDMPETSAHFYNQTIADNYGLVSLLRRHFGLLRPDRIQRFFREERGDDIDFDAVIESVADRHAGITPSDRVYIRREKNLRDVSVAFLVDMSYSTGDELPSGKRIIDIEREGLVLMAEALESIGDQWAVYGFSSNYRDKVDFFVVRDFNESLSLNVKMRFENIKPIAQTRLGAAIRHANSLLAKQASRIRLLVLLSDGRPYDIDYGDADYAIEDTRRALWEGRRKGVNSFCITVDKKSREYLPYMYGEANYTLIDNIESMPARLPLIYKRLTT